MILYPVTIVACMIIISVINIVYTNSLFALDPMYIILVVIASTVAVIAIDGLFAALINALPEKWFNKEVNVTKKEVRFYEVIKIRAWKDKVLELGALGNFRKNKIYDPNNNDYVKMFLMESNYGIWTHILDIISGFSIIFIFPLEYALCFGIPVAIVNVILNILPIFILRYNIPKLKVLYKRNEKRALKECEQNSNEKIA